MTEHNGHPSWEHWNAALWVSNDEWLYTEARQTEREDFVAGFTGFTTPDGCTFTPELAGYAWDTVNEDEEDATQ